jgi:predicted PurR-regulated permease PerM
MTMASRDQSQAADDIAKRSGFARVDAALARVPDWLQLAGVSGWLLTGVALAVVIGAWLVSTSSSISIPLLLAIVLGIVFEPLVGALERHRVPRGLGAAIVMGIVFMAIAFIGVLIVRGLIDQLPSISVRFQDGLHSFSDWLSDFGIDAGGVVDQAKRMLQESTTQNGSDLSEATSGVFGAVGSGLSGTASFLTGLFIAVMLLYYVLADYPRVSEWSSRYMFGLPANVGRGLIEDASITLRGYMRGTTISGFIVASIIAIAALVLKVPLVVAIFTVTFVTCYIPFFGAIVSAIFAFVIALGGAGLTQALILLLVVVLAQNVLQTVINAKVMGDSLNLHPLVILVATMLGGVFGGLLGTTLGAPLTALVIKVSRRLKAARQDAAG